MKKSVFCCILLFFYSFFYLFAEDYKYSLLIREGTWRALNYKITIYSDEPIYMDSSKKVWVKDSYYCTINGKEHGWFEDYFFDSDMTFEHIIWYIEADYWIGNGDSTKIYIPVEYDDEYPSVTYSTDQTFFSSTETEISVAIKDNGVGLKSVNGKNASGEYSETKTFTGEGKHIWSIQATDILDNTITKTKEIFLDITPPVCASLNQETNWCNYEKFYVLSNWTDNLSGVLKCYYSYDKKDWLEGTAATITKEGKNLIYFKAVDRAGNESEIVSTELKIDRTNPTKPIIQKDTQELWTNKSSVKVVASSTDSLSGISKYYYSYDKNNWKEGSSITITEEGSKVIYFKAVDRAGNESEISSADVKIDRTSPANPAIQNETNGEWTSKSSVTVKASSTDSLSGLSRYYYSYDKNNWKEGSSVTITDEGIKVIYFKVVDNAGNESEISFTDVKIDRTSPAKPSIQNETEGKWTNKGGVRVVA